MTEAYGNEWALGMGSVFLLRGMEFTTHEDRLRLMSPLWTYPWAGGVNTCYCYLKEAGSSIYHAEPGRGRALKAHESGAWNMWLQKTQGRCDNPVHSCGFFGVYKNQTGQCYGSVMAVIEGFGKTTIGTLGCRVEKARIVGVGLTLDEEIPNPHRQGRWDVWRPKTVSNAMREEFLSYYSGIRLIGTKDQMLAEFDIAEPPR